jgi:predicted RNA-binding protein with PUA-like domain
VACWLLKTEPSEFAFADLQRDRRATWDGVANATALIHLRAMSKGDQAIIYHTGDERAAVGIAEITSGPYPDPAAGDPRLVVVDLKPVSAFRQPVTLQQIKADPVFAGWDLLRISRLSVMPVPEAMRDRLFALGKGKTP